MESKNIAVLAANALNSKKAVQLKVLKVEELTVLAEYFVIATATSSTHVRALADEVEEVLEKNGVRPHHIEGKTTGWIVIDYSGVIVHIFTPDQREFYSLDRIWSDAEEINLDKILTEATGD